MEYTYCILLITILFITFKCGIHLGVSRYSIKYKTSFDSKMMSISFSYFFNYEKLRDYALTEIEKRLDNARRQGIDVLYVKFNGSGNESDITLYLPNHENEDIVKSVSLIVDRIIAAEK